jgi:putative ABC transport system ATP-binding protein
MIKLENITKVYKTPHFELVALDDVSLEINNAEFIAFRGESGCGKTTLLNIIGMIDNFDSGNYYYENNPIHELNESKINRLRRRKIGFVFQSFKLIDNLNVFENIEMPLLYLNISKSDRENRVNRMLERFNLTTHIKNFPAQLSGGQQQRVAMARAVINEPEIIIADEPTGNLDKKNAENVMSLLQELNSDGVTILMATHSDFISDYAQKAIYIEKGNIVKING